jgi:hypothetical protein
MILLYGCGSIGGPILSAGAIVVFGETGYFLSLAAICCGLAAWTAIRKLAS